MKGPDKYTEDDLVLLLKHQEKAALVYLYDHYAGALNGVIFNIVQDRDFAEDILQEVFVKIWRQMRSYDPVKGRVFTWLHQIARNTAIDAIRSKQWRKRKDSKPLSELHAMHPDDSQGRAEGRELRKSLQALKEDHKILVEMSYFQGYTQAEIAERLKIPLGTVKTRLRVAISRLKQLITN